MLDEHGVHSEARIEHEQGRYVVYLDVYMVNAKGEPSGVVSRRIQEHATRRKAEIAARWIERAARRDTPPSTG